MNPVLCSVCGRSFVPRFAYQTARNPEGATAYFCSVACRTGPGPTPDDEDPPATCVGCGATFRVQYALQTIEHGDERISVCGETCRQQVLTARSADGAGTRVIAVLNQKGGTGKTTTSVSLAAGLAARGHRVLLVDADPQGSVAVSLGVRGARGLYHVLVDGADPMAVAVPAREGLWAVTADRSLSAAEITLAKTQDRWRIMARSFATVAGTFEYVLVDCAPSVSLIGHNALAYARELIVPVSCDYLALVGVKQVLRTVNHVNETLHHPIRVLGVLPTFFDLRNRISRQSVAALREYFQERVMPPIRVSTAFKEAPSLGKTIFEHAAKGRGAHDYDVAVEWLLATAHGTTADVAATGPTAEEDGRDVHDLGPGIQDRFASVLTSEAG